MFSETARKAGVCLRRPTSLAAHGESESARAEPLLSAGVGRVLGPAGIGQIRPEQGNLATDSLIWAVRRLPTFEPPAAAPGA